MWIAGNQDIAPNYSNINSLIKSMDGDFDEITARVTLAKFLRANLGFTFELMSGMKLYEFQELLLQLLFVKDNGIFIGGRGCSKSTLISIFCILYPLFNFNTKICLISANFRSSRRILEEAEKIVNRKDAKLLQACYPNKLQRSTDIYRYKIPNPCGSEVFALPLSNGEGLRGTRASVVLVDEGLLITKEIQESVIRPFLTARQNVAEENQIRSREDELIKAGVIQEKDRVSFPKNKYHIFSSASYQFQYLYEMFEGIVDYTQKPEKIIMESGDKHERKPNYFAVRMSYEAMPPDSFMDMTQIHAAKSNGGENSDYFKREYRALFTDSNDSYFSVRKMHECTIKAGDTPTTQVVGDKSCEYILAIDPSYSASKSSDYFAMGVYLLNPSERKFTLVHTYGRAGGDLKHHFDYLTYLLTSFNIVFVTIDASGDEFIKGYNESQEAQEKGINLGFLESQFDTDDATEYHNSLKSARVEYNLATRKIVYAQRFSSASGAIRRMNEHLQNQLNAGKVWFASPMQAHEGLFEKYKEFRLPCEFKNNQDKTLGAVEFIEEQDEWIEETKNQMALIEVKASSSGNLQYDLPMSLSRKRGDNKVRKDNYTTCLLAAWGSKLYFDLVSTYVVAPKREMALPTILK